MDSNKKDLGSKKINNHSKNEGFSGEYIARNENHKKLNPEIEKNEDGETEIQQRARDIEQKKSVPVSRSNKADSGDRVVDKSRGTENEKEDKEVTKNRDFNSGLDESIH